MANWLYQMSPKQWDPRRYRLDIWEGERWRWPVGAKPGRETPSPGDRLFFFYAKTGGVEPGFYGWAIVLEWRDEDGSPLRFRPVSPSDHLKMDPWWNARASELVDRIRGKVKQGTLWPITDSDAQELAHGISTWLAEQHKVKPA